MRETQRPLAGGLDWESRAQFVGLDELAKTAMKRFATVIAGNIRPALDRLFERAGLPGCDVSLAGRETLRDAKAQQSELWLGLVAGDTDTDPAGRLALLREVYGPLGMTARDVVEGYAYVVGELVRAILSAPREADEAARADAIVGLVRAAFLDVELAVAGDVQLLETRLKAEAARRRVAEAECSANPHRH